MKRNSPMVRISLIIVLICNGPPLLYRMFIELSDGVSTLLDYVFIIGLTTLLYIIIVGLWGKGKSYKDDSSS